MGKEAKTHWINQIPFSSEPCFLPPFLFGFSLNRFLPPPTPPALPVWNLYGRGAAFAWLLLVWAAFGGKLLLLCQLERESNLTGALIFCLDISQMFQMSKMIRFQHKLLAGNRCSVNWKESKARISLGLLVCFFILCKRPKCCKF